MPSGTVYRPRSLAVRGLPGFLGRNTSVPRDARTVIWLPTCPPPQQATVNPFGTFTRIPLAPSVCLHIRTTSQRDFSPCVRLSRLSVIVYPGKQWQTLIFKFTLIPQAPEALALPPPLNQAGLVGVLLITVSDLLTPRGTQNQATISPGDPITFFIRSVREVFTGVLQRDRQQSQSIV